MALIADVGVRHLQTPGTVTRETSERSRESLWFVLLLCAMAWLWQNRHAQWLNAEHGLGYAMGVVAVSCMLLLLIYPVRKRLRFLAFIGPTRRWFQFHMWLGVLAPSAALVHCNFTLGSLNSRIALYSALLVAGSGLIGRVLYRKIHQSLYGRKTDLKRLQADLHAHDGRFDSLPFYALLNSRLETFDRRLVAQGGELVSAVRCALFVGPKLRRERRALRTFAERQIARISVRNPVIRTHRRRLLRAVDDYLASHMAQVKRVARVQAYERLFALWHVVHLPFFLLLVLSVVVHVAAVHLY